MPDAPTCAKCGQKGRVGNPLLGHPPAELVCLACRKAAPRAVGRMGLSGNLHVDDRPTDEAIAEQAAMTAAYYDV